VSKIAHKLTELDKKIIENKLGAGMWTLLTAVNVFFVSTAVYHILKSILYGEAIIFAYCLNLLICSYVIYDWYRHFKWLFPKWRIWIKGKMYKLYKKLDK
jgi:hypothetical protein